MEATEWMTVLPNQQTGEPSALLVANGAWQHKEAKTSVNSAYTYMTPCMRLENDTSNTWVNLNENNLAGENQKQQSEFCNLWNRVADNTWRLTCSSLLFSFQFQYVILLLRHWGVNSKIPNAVYWSLFPAPYVAILVLVLKDKHTGNRRLLQCFITETDLSWYPPTCRRCNTGVLEMWSWSIQVRVKELSTVEHGLYQRLDILVDIDILPWKKYLFRLYRTVEVSIYE